MVSLADSVPPLPYQYVACRANTLRSIKDAILHAAGPRSDDCTPVVSLFGQHGVGKTVTATAVVHDLEVSKKFPQGIAWIQMGEDSSEEDVYNEIITVVETVAGGDFLDIVRHETSLDGIVRFAKVRFAEVSALIVIDDISGTLGMKTLCAVSQIVGMKSVLLTTSVEILLQDEESPFMIAESVGIEPLKPASTEATKVFTSWLYNTFGSEELEIEHQISKYRETILMPCAGLPLALAMAAASVSKSPEAWESVARALTSSMQLEDENLSLGQSSRSFSAITTLLDESFSHGDFGFGSQLRALVALPKGLWVSFKTLADLWDVSEKNVKASARRLGRLAFGDCRLSDSKEQGAVRLCWHVLNYCHRLVSEDDVTAAHQALLVRFSQQGASKEYTPSGSISAWWDVAAHDRYVCHRLCWHLMKAGAVRELRSLLCEFQWLEARIAASSVYGLRLDIEIFMEADREAQEAKSHEGLRQVINALRLLSRFGDGRIVSISNLAPLLVSHLNDLEASDEMSCEILKSIYRDARRPWLRPVGSLNLSAEETVADISNHSVDFPEEHIESQQMRENDEDRPETMTENDNTAENRSYEEAEDEDENPINEHAEDNYIGSITSNELGYAIVGEANGRISVWDVSSRDCLARFNISENGEKLSTSIGAVAALGTDVVVSGHSDGTLRLWSISSGVQLQELRGHDEEEVVTALSVLEPSTIVSGSASGTVLLWLNVLSGGSRKSPRVRHLEAHTDEITALHILPDGDKVATGSFDGFAAIWDAGKPGSDRVSLNGHKDYVVRFASLHSGTQVVSACRGGSVNVWDTLTGQRLWSIPLGFEFGSSEALTAFAAHNFPKSRTRVIANFEASVGFPYFCSQGEDPEELVVVTSIGQNDILASADFEGPISAWSEVWHPRHSRIFVVVAYGGGTLETLELVTAL